MDNIAKNGNVWQNYANVAEPNLSFHIDQPYFSKTKIEGLFKWGPFDSSIPNYPLRPRNPIKVGIIVTKKQEKLIKGYLSQLHNKIELDDLYLKPYKGFREIYGVNLEMTDVGYIEDADISLCSSEKDVLDLYLRKIAAAKDNHDFDLLIITIPAEFESWLEVRKEDYYFHLHDTLKLNAASLGIRTQIIRAIHIPDLNLKKDLLRDIWWLSGAIYTKAGGVLYRIADFDERVLYVGISYAIVRFTSSQKVLVGVAQLFDEQGNNLRLDLFYTSDFTIVSDNPYLKENASRDVFQKILSIYRTVKLRPPSKVIVHKNTPFNNAEIKGIKQALSAVDRIELLYVQKQSPYRAIRLYDQRKAHNYPLLRGTTVKLDDNAFLIWTSGSIIMKTSNGERNYYQENRHIPKPLIINRYYGKDTMEEVASDIMKLTKMNWNNLQYYNKLPVTIDFASRIARISKQSQDIPPKALPRDFRYYI